MNLPNLLPLALGLILFSFFVTSLLIVPYINLLYKLKWTRKKKFILQWILAFIVAYILHYSLGINILHIPLVGSTINLGFWYMPFSAFVIVAFANAFNITDGLDGLASGLLLICL